MYGGGLFCRSNIYNLGHAHMFMHGVNSIYIGFSLTELHMHSINPPVAPPSAMAYRQWNGQPGQ